LAVLQAAVDESMGLQYLAFVIGEESVINKNYSQLPTNFRHMTFMSSDYEKKDLFKSLTFQPTEFVYVVSGLE
jgi:hypothetical protein